MTTNRTAQPDRINRYFVSAYHAPTTGTEYGDLESVTAEAQELANFTGRTYKVWEYPFTYQRDPQPVALVTPLAPETSTEAAQQNAAELEQAPHPAACICDECLKTANSVWELQHPSTGLLHEVRQRNGYYDAPKTSQPDMFAARVDDLPLFSGTAPRGQAQTFNPPAADSHRQAKLF